MTQQVQWCDPIILASSIPESEENWLLLYSGEDKKFSGQYSYLCLGSNNIISDYSELKSAVDSCGILGRRFGYLGYGLKNNLEDLPEDEASYITMPEIWLSKFDLIYVFDHRNQQITVHSNGNRELIEITDVDGEDNFVVENLQSNMTKEEYLHKVQEVRDAIICGDVYQANLTRKFFGELSGDFSHFSLFKKLCKLSPAVYSAFIKIGDNYIISSSPERFLTIDERNNIEARPIKGSAARADDAGTDKKIIEQLANSEKDRAENLMIVDLMRNDFSRSCELGSVKVPSLFDISSYATIHHMSSTVTGQKRQNISSIDALMNCFPPGSMTGTPKIKAMEICSKLEKQARGVYSGAIGWLDASGSADLSVVIRTIVMQGNKFEFQVGGAIVIDSTPESELEETYAKALAICQLLDIWLD